ncbi:MAG: hypothetical protein P1R58_13030, partial [bacterium]|nr:hypothetical protein [bacterium]
TITLSGFDRIENVIIQAPVSLKLTYDLFGVNNGIVPFGGEFSMAVELELSGQSTPTSAEYLVSVTPDIIGGYPSSGIITPGEHIIFDFVAPTSDTVVNIRFEVTSLPNDLNTALPAILDRTEFSFDIRPQSLVGDLLAGSELIGNNLLTPGLVRDLIDVRFVNRAGSDESAISIDSCTVEFYDVQFREIDISSLVDLDKTSFNSDVVGLRSCAVAGNRLTCMFRDLVVVPGDSVGLIFALLFKSAAYQELIVRVDLSQVGAHYSSGPLAGSRPTIAIDGESSRDYRFVVRGQSLPESVVIERNPINPNEEPLRFSYVLSTPSNIEFRIFTLTGEEVYARDIPSGATGAVSGQENIIEWDGRNNGGQIVLNGVYLIYIHVAATGESTSMKVAVLK